MLHTRLILCKLLFINYLCNTYCKYVIPMLLYTCPKGQDKVQEMTTKERQYQKRTKWKVKDNVKTWWMELAIQGSRRVSWIYTEMVSRLYFVSNEQRKPNNNRLANKMLTAKVNEIVRLYPLRQSAIPKLDPLDKQMSIKSYWQR